MELRAIEAKDLDSAVALLERGFPDRPRGFWQRRLEELQEYRQQSGVGPIGTLLNIKGEDVGVLLTIESPGGAKVNLSSWYVDERARLGAARMLQKAVAGPAIYTDLTPTSEVRALNARLGITPQRIGSMLVPVLPDALRPDSATIRDFNQISLPERPRTLLADHIALGLHAAVLKTDDAALPLIFMPTGIRGLKGMRVIYTPSRAALARHRGALARHLVSRGALFVEIEANRSETWSGALHSANRCAVFAKGPVDPDSIDHSYSELVFLHSH